jgi:hypothetical protein
MKDKMLRVCPVCGSSKLFIQRDEIMCTMCLHEKDTLYRAYQIAWKKLKAWLQNSPDAEVNKETIINHISILFDRPRREVESDLYHYILNRDIKNVNTND